MFFFNNGITFPFSYSEILNKWRQEVIPGLNKYMKQIDTNRYNYYIIMDHFSVFTIHLKEQVR